MSRKSALLVVSMFAAACPAPGDPGDCTLVEVDGSVSETTVWKSGTTYHIPYQGFKVDGDLTLEPGVVVKLDAGEKFWVNTGSITAEGTEDEPVIFTSTADDTVGCDVDGAASTPARGDWLGVVLDMAAGAVFDHAEFRYAGESDWPALTLEKDPVSVTNSVFAHNAALGLEAGAANSAYDISGNTFFDNGRPLGISAAVSITDADGNVFHDGAVGNDRNGIFLTQGEPVGVNNEAVTVEWGVTEVPFVMGVGLFPVNAEARLQIHDGVVVKGVEGTEIQFFGDTESLRAGATAVFTSYKDDAIGGDTNGDGAETAPADGDWRGVFDEDFSSEDVSLGTFVNNTNVRYDAIHARELDGTAEHPYTFPLPE